MTLSDYLLNGLLTARPQADSWTQARGLDFVPAGRLGVPAGRLGRLGSHYLHSIPTAGNDLLFEILGLVVGLLLGIGCALCTSVYRDADGAPFAKARWAAAALWIIGVGSRLAFEIYATHGGGPSVACKRPPRESRGLLNGNRSTSTRT